MKYEAAVSGLTNILLTFFDVHSCSIERIADGVAGCLMSGKKILLFGNGGSASEAQHFAAEMVGRFMQDRRAIPAISLTADSSGLTAIGNDLGFDRIFSRQIEALGRPGDVAIALSTSGESANVIEALKSADKTGMITVALTGQGGGRITEKSSGQKDEPSSKTQKSRGDRDIDREGTEKCEADASTKPGVQVDYLLDVPSRSTARVQEAHLVILHLLAEETEKRIGP